ncbi:hypothetical protein [Paraburkholderia aspalathi]|uniref:hypothetical protein n=1 Tax=Paraburkholderia aspalathi TaxID=1324617 RepID=UPI003CBEB5CC
MTSQRIPETTGGREPLKANAFERAQISNTQLLPLFPYVHPGAIVPCCAAFESDGGETDTGYFIHENSVDELALCFGSNGQMRVGDVWVGPRRHGVGDWPGGDHFFAMMTVTQRQLEEGEQTESLTFQCEACNAEVFHYAFGQAEGEGGHFGGMATIMAGDPFVLPYNGSEEMRTCKSCGHVNKIFPYWIWGWGNYIRNTRIVENAWNTLTKETTK